MGKNDKGYFQIEVEGKQFEKVGNFININHFKNIK